MLQYLVLFSLLFSLNWVIIYIKNTLVGKAKPNKISWLMWSLGPIVATFVELSKGVTWAALPVFLSGFGPLCVFIAALFSKKAYWKSTVFDYFCGLFSLLALVLWLAVKEVNISIIFAIISDFSAAIPTIKKSWTHPETEVAASYFLGTLSALTSFAAIKYWIFPEYGFPFYLVILNTLIGLFIIRHKMFKTSISSSKNNKLTRLP